MMTSSSLLELDVPQKPDIQPLRGPPLYNGNHTDVIPLDVVVSACRRVSSRIDGATDIQTGRTASDQWSGLPKRWLTTPERGNEARVRIVPVLRITLGPQFSELTICGRGDGNSAFRVSGKTARRLAGSTNEPLNTLGIGIGLRGTTQAMRYHLSGGDRDGGGIRVERFPASERLPQGILDYIPPLLIIEFPREVRCDVVAERLATPSSHREMVRGCRVDASAGDRWASPRSRHQRCDRGCRNGAP